MPDLPNWVDSVVWPGLFALITVAGAAIAGRSRRWVLSALLCASAVAYLVVVRSEIADLADILGDEPGWLLITAGLTSVSVAATMMTLASQDRPADGAILAGVGVGAAAAAVPDLEIALGVAALWLPLLLLGSRLLAPGPCHQRSR